MVVSSNTIDSVIALTTENRRLRRYQKQTIVENSPSDIKTLIVGRLKELLDLCKETPGKDNKAYVATHIIQLLATDAGIKLMRSNYAFAKTVLEKMNEFAEEPALTTAPFFDAVAFESVKRESRKACSI